MLSASKRNKYCASSAVENRMRYMFGVKRIAAYVARELKAAGCNIEIVSIVLWDGGIYESPSMLFSPATSFAVTANGEVSTMPDAMMNDEERDVLHTLGAYATRNWQQEFSNGMGG